MREYLTTDDISNTICIMVVEGVTDMRLYGKFTEPDKVEIVIAHSKDKVHDSVTVCNSRRNDPKVIGIMDSDLDIIEKSQENDGPIFETDTRDSESLMVMSEALHNVLWEYGDRNKIRTFEERYRPIREAVLEAAYPLGLLMYVSDKYKYGLCFKDLDFYRFINKRTLTCNVQEMIRTVLANTKYRRVEPSTLYKKLSSEMNCRRPYRAVCRGHDLVNVLVIGLRDTFGSYNAQNIREGELGGALRMAYDLRMFAKTCLYKTSQEWCRIRRMDLWRSIGPETLPSSDRQRSP